MTATRTVRDAFDLTGRVTIITGGAGLLGLRHAEAVMEMGGIAVLLDLNKERAQSAADDLSERLGGEAVGMGIDITREEQIIAAKDALLSQYERIDILINNAANNPKVEDSGLEKKRNFSRLENFPVEVWNQDIAVGLTGAFLCSRIFGETMAARSSGVILNVSSDLGVIAPDQTLYRDETLPEDQQPVKPITYSVIKSGLIGMTKYLATYWAERGVRANAIAPGGVFAEQDEAFLKRLYQRIPMRRMAQPDEYKATVVYMVSDASSYMTGAVISVDGGRTCW